jgi:FkbM family methyltransferase
MGFVNDASARIETISYIFQTTKNPLEIIRSRLTNKPFTARFKNKSEQTVNNQKTWEEFILKTHLFAKLPSATLRDESVSFDYAGKNLHMHFGKYGFSTIFEIFAFDPYKDFLTKIDVEGRHVVDIGAAFGDTAIYFITNGAAYVHAYEAFPGYAKLATKNIDENGYAQICKVHSVAVGGGAGTLELDGEATEMFGIDVAKQGAVITVPVVTISDIVETYEITDAVLKLDTEGYEYEILFNTPTNVIRKFKHLLIEYHYGFDSLEAYLKERGYMYFHTGPTDVYVEHLESESSRKMKTGHIVATRIDS